MCTVWHVDKYKITFKLSYQFQENLSWPGVINARARYPAATWRLRNTELRDENDDFYLQERAFVVILRTIRFSCNQEINSSVIYCEPFARNF